MTTVSPAEPQTDAGSATAATATPERRRRVTWRSVLFTLMLVAAAIAVPLLGYTGADILRNEDTGQVVDPQTDANEPGFEALVNPTPTQLVVMKDGDGGVAGAQMLALTDPSGGGTVISVPVGTELEVAFLDSPTKNLDELYEIAGVDGLEQRLETVMKAGMAEVVQVDPEQWAGLIEPLGSLTVENPAAFTGVKADGTLGATFEEGPVTLTPDLVADFVLPKGEGELDTIRNDRQIAFWQAWTAAVAEQGPDSVPGEEDQGLGRFVRGLAAGTTSAVALPVEQVPIPGSAVVNSDVYLPLQDQVDDLSLRSIPFPVGVGRLRTRLVDGVGDQAGLKAEAASLLVANGAEITVISNAAEFGQEQTTVVYFRDDDEPAARAMAEAIGAQLEQGDSTNETVDVVVLIGRDFLAAEDAAENGADGLIEVVPPTSIPIGSEGPTPEIAPGAPGGDPVG